MERAADATGIVSSGFNFMETERLRRSSLIIFGCKYRAEFFAPRLCAVEPLVSRLFVILASRAPVAFSVLSNCLACIPSFFFSLSTSYSLSDRLLDAIIGPPSPPLSSVPPFHFYAICPCLTFQPPTPSTPLLSQISS